MRPRRLVVAPLLLVAAACSSSVLPGPAATVNGVEISRESLEEEIDQIQGNPAYQASVEQQLGPLVGEGEGTYSAAFVSNLLNTQVFLTLLEQRLEEEGGALGDADLQGARTALEQQARASGTDLSSLDAGLLDKLVRRAALVEAVTRAVGGVTDEAVQARYEEDPTAYTEACVRHILVGLEGRTPEEARTRADELSAQLDAGVPFDDLATNASDDSAAAEGGGNLGCGPRGRFLAAFDEAAFSQPVGEVGPPVETEVGFHVILVEERRTPTLDETRERIEQELAQASTTALQDALVEESCTADVEVGARYGTWDDDRCTEEPARVAPPVVRGPSTTTTVLPLPGEAPEG